MEINILFFTAHFLSVILSCSGWQPATVCAHAAGSCRADALVASTLCHALTKIAAVLCRVQQDRLFVTQDLCWLR